MNLREYSIEEKKARYTTFLDHESLFRALDSFLDDVQIGRPMKVVSKIEDWDEAKSFLKCLLAEKYPEKMLKFQIQLLQKKCKSLDYWDEETESRENISLKTSSALVEEYTILLYAKVILDVMFKLYNDNLYKLLSDYLKSYLENHIDFDKDDHMLRTGVVFGFNDKTIVADYDYVHGCPIVQSDEESAEPLKKEVVEEYDGESIVFSSKQVPLEIMKQLFDSAGVDFGRTGTQKPAAQLISALTGIPFNTCKNYLSYGEINKKKYQQEVDRVMAIIDEIDLPIEL